MESIFIQNDTSEQQCIHHLFEDQCIKTPHQIAASYAETQLSYQQLNLLANQLSHYLMSLDIIVPDTLMGVYLPRNLNLVAVILGILKSGAAYVPLDPTYPKERLSFILED